MIVSGWGTVVRVEALLVLSGGGGGGGAVLVLMGWLVDSVGEVVDMMIGRIR